MLCLKGNEPSGAEDRYDNFNEWIIQVLQGTDAGEGEGVFIDNTKEYREAEDAIGMAHWEMIQRREENEGIVGLLEDVGKDEDSW